MTATSARERAHTMLDEGRTEAARDVLREATAEGGASPETRMLLAMAEFRLGDYDRAQAAAEDVLDAAPGHAKAQYYLGLCHERQGRAEDAVAAFRAALHVRPDCDLARHKLTEHDAVSGGSARAPDEPPLTEFHLPRSEAEAEHYVERRAMKERADLRARWQALPLAAKIFQIVVVLLVLAGFVFVGVQMIGAGPPAGWDDGFGEAPSGDGVPEAEPLR